MKKKYIPVLVAVALIVVVALIGLSTEIGRASCRERV